MNYKYYDKKLSDSVKLIMYKLMKNAHDLVQGFIFFRNRMILKTHLDKDGCEQLLKDMVINKDNVVSYLYRKYIPTWKSDTHMIFKDQACIQSVKVMPDKTLYIHIKNSEPHKIITDTFYVMELLTAKGVDFIPECKYYIEMVKVAYQDTMLYNLCIDEFGYKVPSVARQYERELKFKFSKLENVAKIKKRSVKRKFCRYHVKRGMMTWQELRDIINITDFSERNIKVICDRIRKDNIDRGVNPDY